MPPDEGIRFHIPQSIAPSEHSAQSRHHPTRGIIGPSRFNLAFLKQRQLLPEEQILNGKPRRERTPEATRPPKSGNTDHRSNETVPQSGEQNQRSGHERSGSHVTKRYKMLPHAAEEVFADHTRLNMVLISLLGPAGARQEA